MILELGCKGSLASYLKKNKKLSENKAFKYFSII